MLKKCVEMFFVLFFFFQIFALFLQFSPVASERF